VTEGGRPRLSLTDPEGQRLELVVGGDHLVGRPWEASPVPPEFQVLGLDAVTLASTRAQATADFLQAVFSLQPTAESDSGDGRVYTFAFNGGGPGRELKLAVRSEPPPSVQGKGGVHHVAFRVPDGSAQEEWRRRVMAAGLYPTPVIDRFYFKSVYFREPGGNLFEIATDGPGFAADEPVEKLGERLALPPFLEPRREQIEAGLVPIG
jgi:glyoxalase family protein